MRILHWEENLLPDEMPPEWMWPFNDELVGWFEDVKADRDARSSNRDDDEGLDTLVDNELAPKVRRR